jgi:hypothetical protein
LAEVFAGRESPAVAPQQPHDHKELKTEPTVQSTEMPQVVTDPRYSLATIHDSNPVMFRIFVFAEGGRYESKPVSAEDARRDLSRLGQNEEQIAFLFNQARSFQV